MSSIISGFKFGIGLLLASFVAVGVYVGGAFALEFISESCTEETYSPDVTVTTINHWKSEGSASPKLMIVGEVANNSDIKWSSLEIAYVLKDGENKFLKRCSEILYYPKLENGPVNFEVKCFDPPSNLDGFTYELELYGRY
ncbi:hypothetical protein ACFSJ3_01240 [Corallincola platygyrae]|uniref:Uncharacterized protein n=1 Tax=Corallincola platygyrae TaxID=1193278 RepID=A0ABW4XGG5_9GAMM